MTTTTDLTGEITIRELVNLMHDATERMSVKNRHRALMMHAMSAIMQMYVRVEALETPGVKKPTIEIPRVELAH